MDIYLRVFKTTIDEFFVYRLNFVLWRTRNLVTLGIKYFLWVAVFEQSNVLFGYTESQMLTYILLSNIISDIAMSTKTDGIAGEILKGDIVNYILRPLPFFKYHAVRDISDKFINISFSVFEVLLFVLIFKPEIFIQTNVLMLLASLLFVIIGTSIAFFLNMSMSFIGFWSNEVWAPRFIFWMLVLVFAGAFFPLDILPRVFYYAIFLTPFPYLYFLPTRVYLGVPPTDLVLFFFAGIAWVVLSYKFTKFLWNKGLREFSFFGR